MNCPQCVREGRTEFEHVEAEADLIWIVGNSSARWPEPWPNHDLDDEWATW